MSCLYDIDSGRSSFDPRVSYWNIHSKEEEKNYQKVAFVVEVPGNIPAWLFSIARQKARFIEMTGVEAGDE